MTGLKSVKLPLKLAQSSGLDSGAFNGCTTLSTIEFDLNVSDLGTIGDAATNNVTALTNIYKMFAASGNDFGNNTQIGESNNAPAKT